jgi:phosphoribosylpyrophosphate synthetase
MSFVADHLRGYGIEDTGPGAECHGQSQAAETIWTPPPLIGEAIRRTHNEESISSLFI